MDSFSFNNLQAEKANAILKHRKLRRVASFLRFVEVCLVIVLISRLSLRLPLAVKNSSEYFRDWSVLMNSPGFVFLIGNLIIIALFAQSGQFSAQGAKRNTPEPDLYHEFVQNSTKNQRIQEGQKHPEKQSIGTESEKQSIGTGNSIKDRRINGNLENYPENHRIYQSTKAGYRYSIKNQGIDAGKSKWTEKQSMKTGGANNGLELKVKGYRRCQTEILRRVESEKGVLRRCDTEKVGVGGISYPEDDMSNEEFRRTVEAFIAKQQRLRREEHYSVL